MSLRRSPSRSVLAQLIENPEYRNIYSEIKKYFTPGVDTSRMRQVDTSFRNILGGTKGALQDEIDYINSLNYYELDKYMMKNYMEKAKKYMSKLLTYHTFLKKYQSKNNIEGIEQMEILIRLNQSLLREINQKILYIASQINMNRHEIIGPYLKFINHQNLSFDESQILHDNGFRYFDWEYNYKVLHHQPLDHKFLFGI